jgi:hypothetical protein
MECAWTRVIIIHRICGIVDAKWVRKKKGTKFDLANIAAFN